MATDSRDQLRSIKKFPSLVKYLRDELDWPIESDDFEELTFDFTPEELGIDKKNAAKIQEIKRLRPLTANQPMGIFFVKFEKKKLPVVALRRLLNAVALKKRASAASTDQAAWHADDLLFISNYGEEEDRKISFANFSQDKEKKNLPVLKVLGWDDRDTALHLDDVAETLGDKFTWDKDYNKDPEGWGNQWRSAFTVAHGEVVRTSKDMAVRLAELARGIRNRINEVLTIENDKGPVRQLMAAFKEALIDDLDDDGFADMYAQTIAYGLLSARITNPSGDSPDDLPTAMPITNPFLKELMEQFLQVGGRKKGGKKSIGIDFDELGVSDVVELLDAANMEAVIKDFGDQNPQEDPVIHFFEGFLQEYDKKIRKDRGVFYTPRPVVSFIVRSVDELLRTEFGLEDGLADTNTWGEMVGRIDDLEIPEGAMPEQAFVQILDPATGTGTFLVEVIDLIHNTMTKKWKREGKLELEIPNLWNDYVPEHLLPRLHGYELMMAPYAIAHMKIGLKLYETGYLFESDERARVYLTNALEPAQDFSGTLAFAIPALAHEAEAVNAIKRDQRFTVVIGNPPYSHRSSNLTANAMRIVEPYKFIDGVRIKERGALSLQKNLQDDYVKFIRVAEEAVMASEYGICGLISNNSYFDSRSFRGMRFTLAQTFSHTWLLDLHGSGKKSEQVDSESERDENVFDIMQGVGISLFVRRQTEASLGAFYRFDLLGQRNQKYQFLAEATFSRIPWEDLQISPPFYPFIKQDVILLEEYQSFTPLHEIFPTYSSGVKTHRDAFAYAFDASEMEGRIKDLCDKGIPDQSLRERFGLKETNVWSLPETRSLVDQSELESRIQLSLYRPFDFRVTCFSDSVIELTRRAVMDSMSGGKNLALLCSKQQAEEGFRHVFCTRLISDCQGVSNRTRETTSAFPLHESGTVDTNAGQLDFGVDSTTKVNICHEWLTKYGSSHDVFSYVYAVLHAPVYRKRYAAFLRSDFPRLPLCENGDLFSALVVLGLELVEFHLLESSKLHDSSTALVGSGELIVEKVSYSDETIWIDRAKTRGFKGVPEEVWNFRIGGYQVCEKWLKDRQTKGGKNPRPGRVLTDEDIEHYQKIVVALAETIRIMSEIDEVIESYGGWPGAFQTEEPKSQTKES